MIKKLIYIIPKLVYIVLLCYIFRIIHLYIDNYSKKIYKLNGDYIIETHNLTYMLSIILMKLGLFGFTPNYINIAIYSYIANQINKKANMVFINDMICKTKILQFIDENNFSLEQINEIKYTDYTTKIYPTMNHFFAREIKLELRNNIFDKYNFYSPADARTKFLKTIDTMFEIKGKYIKLNEIGFNYYSSNDIIMISRLIPSDYHRYHSPVTGIIKNIIEITSEINTSVNCMVIPEFNPYTLNSRKIITIELYNMKTIEICFIAATFVGDIILHNKIGDYVKAGDELGYFKLGSCIVTKLHDIQLIDILYNNEYYIQVGDKLGKLL